MKTTFVSPRTKVLLSPKGDRDQILQSMNIQASTPLRNGSCAQVIGCKIDEERVALKEEFIKSPTNQKTRPYREYIIHEHLNKLSNKTDHFPDPTCAPFIKLKAWFKSRDDGGGQTSHTVMDRADTTLADVELSFEDFKAISFQIIFGLYVAHKHYEFVHGDLHSRNILLVKNKDPSEYSELKDGDNCWYIRSHWRVKLCDFGNSQIILPTSREFISNRTKSTVQADLANLKYYLKTDLIARWISKNDFVKLGLNPESFEIFSKDDACRIQDLVELETDVREKLRLVEKEKRKSVLQFRRILDSCCLEELVTNPFFNSLKLCPPNKELKKCIRELYVPNQTPSTLSKNKRRKQDNIEDIENQKPNVRIEKPITRSPYLFRVRKKSLYYNVK